MKAVFTMWRNTRMIILTAVCAAIYSASLLAFKKVIPLQDLTDFTLFIHFGGNHLLIDFKNSLGNLELSIGKIIPIPFGLMFGPAGAWGSAIGNLIGDIFGDTLSPVSLSGFVGNFLQAYLPYALWTTLVPFNQKNRDWNPRNGSNWATYILVAVISSIACAVVISIFVDFMGLVPYKVLFKLISLANILAGLIGVILLTAVFKLVKNYLHLFWAEIMAETDYRKPTTGPLGAWLVTAGSLLGLIGGLITGFPVNILGLICVPAILVGSFLL